MFLFEIFSLPALLLGFNNKQVITLKYLYRYQKGIDEILKSKFFSYKNFYYLLYLCDVCNSICDVCLNEIDFKRTANKIRHDYHHDFKTVILYIFDDECGNMKLSFHSSFLFYDDSIQSSLNIQIRTKFT